MQNGFNIHKLVSSDEYTQEDQEIFENYMGTSTVEDITDKQSVASLRNSVESLPNIKRTKS